MRKHSITLTNIVVGFGAAALAAFSACGGQAPLDSNGGLITQTETEKSATSLAGCLPTEEPNPTEAPAIPSADPMPFPYPPPAPAPDPAPSAVGSPSVAGCPMLPPDNEWNRSIANDPVDPASDRYIAAMNGGSRLLHPDFGGNGEYGIPWITVSSSQERVPMEFEYSEDSDPGPYPIPADAPIEGGPSSEGDRHILVLDRDTCQLYETWSTYFVGPGWRAGSGAIFDMRSNNLRPDGWTSADAAGLPILPGLVRHDEVKAGKIAHALRFTVKRTQRAYVFPATHYASNATDESLPPMGLRVRLKADFDISGFNDTAKVILTALKEYGMFVADNGGDWFLTGEANPAWNDDELDDLRQVPANAFEVVQHGTVSR